MEKLIKLFNFFRSDLVEDLRDSYNNGKANFDRSEEAFRKLKGLKLSSGPSMFEEVITELISVIESEFNRLKSDVVKYLNGKNKNKDGYANGVNSSLDMMKEVFKTYIKGSEPGDIVLNSTHLVDPIVVENDIFVMEFCKFVNEMHREMEKIERKILDHPKDKVDKTFIDWLETKLRGIELDIENRLKYSKEPLFTRWLDEPAASSFKPNEHLLEAKLKAEKMISAFFSTNLAKSLEKGEDFEKILRLFLIDLSKLQEIFYDMNEICASIHITSNSKNKINMIKKSLNDLGIYLEAMEKNRGYSSIDDFRKSLEKINYYLDLNKKSELSTNVFEEARNILEDVISKLKYSDNYVDKSLFSALNVLNDLIRENSGKSPQNLDSPEQQIPAVYRTPDQDFTKNTKDFGEIQNYNTSYPEKISEFKSKLKYTSSGKSTFYYRENEGSKKVIKLLSNTLVEKPTNFYLIDNGDGIDETNVLIEKPEEDEFIINVDKIDKYLDNPYCLDITLKPIRIINSKQLYFNDVNVQEYNKRKVLSNHGEIISESPDGYYVRTPEANYNIYVHKVDVIKEE